MEQKGLPITDCFLLIGLKNLVINSDTGFLMLQKKSAGRYQTVSQEKIPEELSVSATRWPSFSTFELASDGSIVLENEDYNTKVVVSPIGRIRQTAIGRK